MIGFFKTQYTDSVIGLWSEVFGDTAAWIEKYLSAFGKFLVVYKEEDRLLGMLSLLPVKCGSLCGRYVYAVATDKKARGRGIATRLLDYAKDFIKENNEDFLVLVPSNSSLFDFYGKRGFAVLNCIKKSEIEIKKQCEDISDFEKISAAEYSLLQKELLQNTPKILWDTASLEKIASLYNGDFYRSKKQSSIAFCVKDSDTLYIKELLSENEVDFMPLAAFYDVKKIVLTRKGNNPFAMVYPERFKNSYFNVAID